MSLETVFENKIKYLYARVTGVQSLENNLSLASACVKACEEANNKRLLLDITGTKGQPGTFADYELARIIQSWEIARKIEKCALLERPEELPAGKFFETAARNVGFNLYVFSDKEEAIKWLEA